jgi:hypothetical protein
MASSSSKVAKTSPLAVAIVIANVSRSKCFPWNHFEQFSQHVDQAATTRFCVTAHALTHAWPSYRSTRLAMSAIRYTTWQRCYEYLVASENRISLTKHVRVRQKAVARSWKASLDSFLNDAHGQ